MQYLPLKNSYFWTRIATSNLNSKLKKKVATVGKLQDIWLNNCPTLSSSIILHIPTVKVCIYDRANSLLLLAVKRLRSKRTNKKSIMRLYMKVIKVQKHIAKTKCVYSDSRQYRCSSNHFLSQNLLKLKCSCSSWFYGVNIIIDSLANLYWKCRGFVRYKFVFVSRSALNEALNHIIFDSVLMSLSVSTSLIC